MSRVLFFCALLAALIIGFSYFVGIDESTGDQITVYSSVISASDLSRGYKYSYSSLSERSAVLVLTSQKGLNSRLMVKDSDGAIIGSSDLSDQIRGVESVFFESRGHQEYTILLDSIMSTENGVVELQIVNLSNETPFDRHRIEAERIFSNALRVTDSDSKEVWKPRAELIGEACSKFELIGATERLAVCLLSYAWVNYKYLEDWIRAEELARRAEPMFRNKGQELVWATVLRILGESLIETPYGLSTDMKEFRQKEADINFEAAMNLQSNAKADLAWTINSQAYGQFGRGYQKAAIEGFDKAQKLALKAGAEYYHLVCLKNFLITGGDADDYRSILRLEGVLDGFAKQIHPTPFGLTSLSLGELYLNRGYWDKSIANFNGAIQSLSSPSDILKAKLGLARAYFESGNLHRAIAFVRRDVTDQDFGGESSTILKFSVIKSDIAMAQGDIDAAKGVLAAALPLLKNPRDKAYIQTAQSRVFLVSAQYQRAVTAAEVAKTNIDKDTDRERYADTLLVLAEAKLRAGAAFRSVKEVLDEADSTLKARRQILLEARSEFLHARLNYLKNDLHQSLIHSEKAVELVWQQRFVTGNVDYRNGLLDKKSAIFEQHADIIWALSKTKNDDNVSLNENLKTLMLYVDGIRARNSERYNYPQRTASGGVALKRVRDRISNSIRTLSMESKAKFAKYKHVEEELGAALLEQDLVVTLIQEGLDEIDVPELYFSSEGFLKIQAALPYGTVILSYWLRGKASSLWMISSDEVKVFSIDEPERVEKLAIKLHAEMSKVGKDFGPTLAELKRLILPQDLDSFIEDIYLIPDGALHYLPAATLFEDHIAVTTISAISDIGRASGNAPTAMKSIALFGNPIYENRQLSSLPASGSEISEVAKLFDTDARTFVGLKASRENFINEASNYDIVHVAAHGRFDASQPLVSGIIFTDLELQPKEESQSFLTLADIRSLNFERSPLVVLSACKTAFGRNPTLEGYSGFPNAFLAAGASAVLVSLWNVPDSSTSPLMRMFYEGLIKSKLKPKAALREAQNHMRENRRWRHPIHWAGWILIEN